MVCHSLSDSLTYSCSLKTIQWTLMLFCRYTCGIFVLDGGPWNFDSQKKGRFLGPTPTKTCTCFWLTKRMIHSLPPSDIAVQRYTERFCLYQNYCNLCFIRKWSAASMRRYQNRTCSYRRRSVCNCLRNYTILSVIRSLHSCHSTSINLFDTLYTDVL